MVYFVFAHTELLIIKTCVWERQYYVFLYIQNNFLINHDFLIKSHFILKQTSLPTPIFCLLRITQKYSLDGALRIFLSRTIRRTQTWQAVFQVNMYVFLNNLFRCVMHNLICFMHPNWNSFDNGLQSKFFYFVFIIYLFIIL